MKRKQDDIPAVAPPSPDIWDYGIDAREQAANDYLEAKFYSEYIESNLRAIHELGEYISLTSVWTLVKDIIVRLIRENITDPYGEDAKQRVRYHQANLHKLIVMCPI